MKLNWLYHLLIYVKKDIAHKSQKITAFDSNRSYLTRKQAFQLQPVLSLMNCSLNVIWYSMIEKLNDEFNSRKKEACLVKRKDHYGFQIHKNDINTRVATRKSNHFTPYI